MGSRGPSFHNFYRSVVVTFSALWMVKVPLHQVVGMVAMRNRFMATSWGVLMPAGVASTIVMGLG